MMTQARCILCAEHRNNRKVHWCVTGGGALLSLSNEVGYIGDQYAVLLRMDCNNSAVIGLRVDEFAEQNAGLAHDHVLCHGQLLGMPPPVHPLTPCPSSKEAIGNILLTFWSSALKHKGIFLTNALRPLL